MLVDHESDARAVDLVSTVIPQEWTWIRCRPSIFFEVITNQRCCGRPQRNDALFASFPGNSYQRKTIEAKVHGANVGQFLDAGARVVEKRQEEIVASPLARRAVGTVQDRLQFGLAQGVQKASWRFLEGKRLDSLCDGCRGDILGHGIRKE